jgi:hypothetical protein
MVVNSGLYRWLTGWKSLVQQLEDLPQAKLTHITWLRIGLIVDIGRYIQLLTTVYKPSYNWGGTTLSE